MDDMYRKVEEALNTIRPYLEADGGNVEVLEITDNHILKLELTGACKTCSMSRMTLKAGIEETIRKAVPEIKEILSIQN
jgi:Fe-S cluster biogenesis protein NfuA